jgi:hypothetical protein
MVSALHKRLEKLEQALAQRNAGPKTARLVVIADGDEIPPEGADELLICRVIVSPPERAPDAPLPEATTAVSPRIDMGGRTQLEIQREDERFRRRINYPPLGLA